MQGSAGCRCKVQRRARARAPQAGAAASADHGASTDLSAVPRRAHTRSHSRSTSHRHDAPLQVRAMSPPHRAPWATRAPAPCRCTLPRARCYPTPRSPQQVRRHPDGVPPIVAHLARHRQQVLRLRELGQLDQHRQVDAGDDLDAIVLEKRQPEVRRRAPEHVGQQQHAPAVLAATRSIAWTMSSRASFTSSCQPIETAVNCGRSPTIISAALTSSVASCPWVTTTTPIIPTS